MTSPKKRRRARHRVERTMEEAFEAAAKGRLALADKLSRRAVDEGFVNPRIWRDRGRVARLCGQDDVAEQAFRHAIAIAPTYALAFAELARLQWARGKGEAAERLLRRAVELRPQDAELRREHALLLAARGPLPVPAVPAPVVRSSGPVFTALTERFEWGEVAAELEAHGVSRLPGLLGADACARIAAFGGDDARVEAEVVRADAAACATYRFLRPPLPEPVAALRDELYARLGPIADAWQERLGRRERFEATRTALTARCAAAGRHRSDVALLRLEDGGFVAPAPEAPPPVAFPFRAVVALGPGGTVSHVLRDLRPGRKVHARRTEVRVGDGLVACDRQRIVRIAGVDGLQDVGHGFGGVTGGPGDLLLLPFVEGA